MTASRVCITATLAAALLLDAASAGAAALDRARLTRWSASVVKVEATDADARAAIGSGVAVAPERIVTNCHVTRNAEQVFVIHRGLRWRAVAQSPDTEHDLCVLQVPGLAAVSAELGAAHTLRVGEPVWAFGFEGGIRLQVRSGIVRALHAYDDGWVVESTTPFTSGASGGALFDNNGRLAAILTYRLRGDRRSYFSVPVEWFLQRVSAEQSYAIVMPLRPASPFWERAQSDLPFFLRAHQLELGADWDALLKLTDEWSKAETGNAEPWLLRGRSFTQTHDLPAAQAALEHAIELDPASGRAWLELGRLSAHRGSVRDAHLALAHLNRFSPELARCLAAELPFESQIAADADVENCSSL
jgi:serine protease Do